MSLVDPTGRILTEIRDDATVAALVAGRVRPGEPAPKTADYEGDALGAGKYKPFVVLARLASLRLKRAPIQEVRLVARCYGATFQGAAELAAAVSAAIHAKGHRISAGGVAIFGSFDGGGGGAAKDPDTGQPVETLLIQVNASTQLIT